MAHRALARAAVHRDQLAVLADHGGVGRVGDDHRVGHLPVGEGDGQPRLGRSGGRHLGGAGRAPSRGRPTARCARPGSRRRSPRPRCPRRGRGPVRLRGPRAPRLPAWARPGRWSATPCCRNRTRCTSRPSAASGAADLSHSQKAVALSGERRCRTPSRSPWRPPSGRSPTCSSRGPTVTSNPRSVPSCATRVAMDSGGPEVGPEEDGEPRAVLGHEEGWSERRPGARGRRVRSGGVRSAGPVDVHAGTGTHPDVEVGGLDCQRGLDPRW